MTNRFSSGKLGLHACWLRLLSCAIALASCALMSGAQAQMLANIPADHGVLLVKVPVLARVSFSNGRWTSMKVHERETGHVETLSDLANAGANYALFAADLPAGHYTIDALSAAGSSPTTFGVFAAAIIGSLTSDHAKAESLQSFEILPGHLTNLGVMLSDPDSDHGFAPVTEQASTQSALNELPKDLRNRLASWPTSGWDGGDDMRRRATAEALITAHATRISVDYTSAGSVLVGTPLGEVHERDPDGHWTTWSTGGVEDITVVKALADGRVFAATDTSSYYVKDASGNWHAGELPDGASVRAATPLGDHGIAIVVARFKQGPQGYFYAATEQHLLLAMDAQNIEAARRAMPDMGAPEATPVPPVVFFDGQRVTSFATRGGWGRPSESLTVDPETGSASKASLGGWLLEINRTADGLFWRTRQNGTTLYVDTSTDGGNTWQPTQDHGPSYASFSDAMNGVGFVRSTGFSSVGLQLVETVDGGKNWNKKGAPIEGYTSWVSVHRMGARIFAYTGRQLLSTADTGATWQVEWPRGSTLKER